MQLTEINRLLKWDKVIIDAQKRRVVHLCFCGENARKAIELLWSMEQDQEKHAGQFDRLLDQLRQKKSADKPELPDFDLSTALAQP